MLLDGYSQRVKLRTCSLQETHQMAKLLISHPTMPYREYTLGTFNTVGRHPKQDVQIHDRVVSKEHALITRAEDSYWLQDNNSRNGTFVNGDQIKGMTKLKTQDVIRLGDTQLRFVNEELNSSQMLQQNTVMFQNAQQSYSSIRTKIDNTVALDKNFRPEREIVDVASLREDYEKLRAIFELHEGVGGELELQALLDRILNTVFQVIRPSRGVILLENGSGQLEPMAFRDSSGSAQEPFGISETILQEVRENHSAVLSDDAKSDSRFEASQSIVLSDIRSVMCVPLIYSDDLLGVVYLDAHFAQGSFTEKDLKVMAVLAYQASAKIANARLTQRAEEEAKVRGNLSRLLSPNLVDEVVKGNIEVHQGGTMVEATVCFIDIRGFTRVSEQMSPQDLISTLNSYFEIMVDIIFQHDGTLDKFIGDEIMAVWGAPIAQEDHALRALRATYEIRDAINRFNRFRVANNQRALEIGCGINSGAMVAGYLGSSKTLSYTVLGDTVNVAARLCSAAKPNEILLSDPLREIASSEFILDVREPTQFKGKSKPLGVFELKQRIGGSGEDHPVGV